MTDPVGESVAKQNSKLTDDGETFGGRKNDDLNVTKKAFG
jgi:hypothetical protein